MTSLQHAVHDVWTWKSTSDLRIECFHKHKLLKLWPLGIIEMTENLGILKIIWRTFPFVKGRFHKFIATLIGKTDRMDCSQVLRYCFQEGAEPLWPSPSPVPRDSDIPPCQHCGSKRRFEFQVRPPDTWISVSYILTEPQDSHQCNFASCWVS